MAATYIKTILLASLLQNVLPGAIADDGLLPKHSEQESKAADTVRALDTNGNGKVDKSEIATFAKSQGLSTEEVLADFQELDVNKDGELDSSEISGLLGGEPEVAQADSSSTSSSAHAHAHAQAQLPPVDSAALASAAELAATPKEATLSASTPALRSRHVDNSAALAAAAKLAAAPAVNEAGPSVATPVHEPRQATHSAAIDNSAALAASSTFAVKTEEPASSAPTAGLRSQKNKDSEIVAQALPSSKVLDEKTQDSREDAMRNMGLDLAALELDAQRQAGNVMASQLAQRAQVLLARSDADERKAEHFDGDVRALRGNATALAHRVDEETREVASKTVSDVAQKSLAKLKVLQEEEHKAEMAADEHRVQAAKAMKRVREAQAALRES